MSSEKTTTLLSKYCKLINKLSKAEWDIHTKCPKTHLLKKEDIFKLVRKEVRSIDVIKPSSYKVAKLTASSKEVKNILPLDGYIMVTDKFTEWLSKLIKKMEPHISIQDVKLPDLTYTSVFHNLNNISGSAPKNTFDRVIKEMNKKNGEFKHINVGDIVLTYPDVSSRPYYSVYCVRNRSGKKNLEYLHENDEGLYELEQYIADAEVHFPTTDFSKVKIDLRNMFYT